MKKPKRKGKPKDDPYPDWRWLRNMALILFVIFGIPLIGLIIFARSVQVVADPDPSMSALPDEIVIVPFNKIDPTYTTSVYNGQIYLLISGTGQAGGTDWSDAFYLHAHGDGTPYDPPQLEHFDLEINGQRAIYTLGLLEDPPPYSSSHYYWVRFNMGSEARRIAFRISDSIVDDNTGEFRIEVWHGQ